MANITGLKAVRTRYRNVLDKEMTNAIVIIGCDIKSVKVGTILEGGRKCLKLIRTYSSKLEEQMNKLTASVGDTDSDFVDRVIQEDCDTMLEAENVIINLEHFLDSIKCLDRKEEKDPGESPKKPGGKSFDTIRLPKLELPYYNGDKLRWVEFWDAFECTVHTNVKLSNIEKFNYLLSKLKGEAKRAVEGIGLSNENYEVAVTILKERFGNKQEVINMHYKELINLPPAVNRVESLRSLMDAVERNIRSLEVLKENVQQSVFVSMITSKLPVVVLRQLELNKDLHTEWTVNSLRESIQRYVSACEKSEGLHKEHKYTDNKLSQGNYKRHQDNIRSYYQKPTGSAEALMTTADSVNRRFNRKCMYCDGNHWSDECNKYKSVDDRKKQLKGACYKCLRKGHGSKECNSKRGCVYCGQFNTHHRSLCSKQFGNISTSVHMTEENNDRKIEDDSSGVPVFVSSHEMVLMQTAKAKISNEDHTASQAVRIMLDSGSQRTYISQKLANQLRLKVLNEQEIKLVTFGSDKPQTIRTKSTEIRIQVKNGSFMKVVANIVPTISAAIQRSRLKELDCPEIADMISSVELADTIPNEKQMSSVEILVGNDYYLDLVLPQRIELKPGLYLLASKLGWIISGRSSGTSTSNESPNLLILSYNTGTNDVSDALTDVDSVIPVKPDLTDFWRIESIGIKEEETTSEDTKAMEQFKSSLKFYDGRYQVTWPWKSEQPELPVNRELAFGRLKSCLRQLQKKPDLLEKYDAIIQNQLNKGIIEKVDKDDRNYLRHYLPHHAVITPQKTTTKVRIVYDASAKTKQENLSLNQCLYRGPVLLHDLSGLLMRFRMHSVVMVADIEKAFLQIGLQPSQRDVTRFLWIKDKENISTDQSNIQEFRFCRVPFGAISSPFLLAATIESHLDSYKDNSIAQQLKDDIYVDNVITGTEDTEGAIQLYKTTKGMFHDASMNIREWISNSPVVNESIPDHDRADIKDMCVLGHKWDCNQDTLSLKIPEDNDETMTKRHILKRIASVFDPLGLFSPVLLPGKILLQDLWSLKVDWDDHITDENLIKQWRETKNEISKLTSIQLERCVSMKAKEEVSERLVAFCDASSKAYAVCIYIHQERADEVHTDLIFSKTRLAPVKEITIPRLELMAVLIGTQCLKFVQKQLNRSIEEIYLFTDSRCVLGWLDSSRKLPVFVRNRVNEIKGVPGIQTSYVHTKDNPADIATRGIKAMEMRVKTMWWKGPDWLAQPHESWNMDEKHTEIDSLVEVCIPAAEPENQSNKTMLGDIAKIIDSEKYSSVTYLMRVTAYVGRFFKIIRKQDWERGNLKSSELAEAENKWLKSIQHKHYEDVFHGVSENRSTNIQRQLGIYIDSEGLLRCKGRVENACLTESARYPLLLPSKDRLTEMIIEKVHQNLLHSGVSHTLANVRQRFWIPKGRAIVKKVLKRCFVCRRYEGGPYKTPNIPPLPKARVTESAPFIHTGLDYLGPVYIRTTNGPMKTWICLFTCLVTRAVHLELVLDVTTKEFLMCLRRFVAQRGAPHDLISDNAKQFKAANVILDRVWKPVVESADVQSYMAERSIKWSYIVELAPWMGGFYERLVGVVKRSLKKSIGRNMLTIIQMQTLIKEIEAVTNSRPLVYVGDDINSSITLTPGHFLTLNPSCGVPDIESNDNEERLNASEKLARTWKRGQKLLTLFWKIWRDDYLLSLRERMQYSIKGGRVISSAKPEVGDVVTIKDSVARGSWKLGRIIQLVKSGDNQIRSAKVKTATGCVVKRPVKLLYPLESTLQMDQITPQDRRVPVVIEDNSGKIGNSNREKRRAAVVAWQRIQNQL